MSVTETGRLTERLSDASTSRTRGGRGGHRLPTPFVPAEWADQSFPSELEKLIKAHAPDLPRPEETVDWDGPLSGSPYPARRLDASPRPYLPLLHESVGAFLTVLEECHPGLAAARDRLGSRYGALAEDVRHLIAKHNIAGDGSLIILAPYARMGTRAY